MIAILLVAAFAMILLWCVPASVKEIRTVDVGSASAPAPSGPVDKENYRWKPVAIGGGGFVTGQSIDRSGDTHVVRTDVYGAYIWQPSVDRWVQLVTSRTMPEADRAHASMQGGVYEIAVAPSDGKRIYMVAKGMLYRSDDRGAHFVRAWAGDPIRADANSAFRMSGPYIAVAPDDPDLVLVGTPEQGLWRSADAGKTWGVVDSVPPSADLRPKKDGVQAPGAVIWFSPKGQIWAMAAGHGLYLSQDRGKSFRAAFGNSPVQPRFLQHGVFLNDGKFLGTDPESRKLWLGDGKGWQDIAPRVDSKPRAFGAVVVDDSTIYLFDLNGRGYRSGDDGATWHRISRRLVSEKGDAPWLAKTGDQYFGLSTILLDPKHPHRLLGSTGIGFFYADPTPLGPQLTWTGRSRGIEELVTNDIAQPPGGAPLFAAWDFGIHRKPDLDAYSTSWGPEPRSLIAAQQLAWGMSDPKFIVTNASDTRMGCCSEDGKSILAGYSADGGQSWSRFATLPVPPGTKADDPWAMSFGTIAVAAGDTSTILWAPAFNRAAFRTADRGQTWQRIVLPGEIGPRTGSFPLFYYSRRTMVADRVLARRFYWYHAGEAPNAALHGLWRTDDGGRSWIQAFKGPVLPFDHASTKLRAVPGHAGHLFMSASMQTNGDTRLRRSVDGGTSWVSLDTVDQVDDIAFGKAASGSSYPAIYISGRVDGQYGIWRSIDDTRSWRRLADFPMGRLDQVANIGADPDRFGRVYVGYVGSGWVYGEPATCEVASPSDGDVAECVAVR